MEFEVKQIGYFQRIIRGLFMEILIAIALFISLHFMANVNNLIGAIISVFYIIFTYVRFEHWYRFYMTKVIIHNETVSVEIYDRNKKREYIFKVEEIELRLGKSISYGSLYKLIFKEKGIRKFVQYQIGGWKKEKILELYDALKHAKQESPPLGER